MPNQYVNKVNLADGTSIIDISDTTATADKILQGYGAYGKDGAWMDGTAVAGSGSAYTLLASDEVDVTTTSTTAVTEKTIDIIVDDFNSKMFFCVITDKDGPRNGYFYKSVMIYDAPSSGSVTNSYRPGSQTINVSSTGAVQATSTSQYGVWCAVASMSLKIVSGVSTPTVSFNVRSRYNSTYSGTVDGTYTIEIYSLAWPNNASPFA